MLIEVTIRLKDKDMPVVPTQLLGFADGAMSQGWSTMYDCKILNADLLISANIVA